MKTKEEIKNELNKVQAEMLMLNGIIDEAKKVEQAAINHRIMLGKAVVDLVGREHTLINILENMD